MEQIRLAVGIPAYRAEIAAEQAAMWMEFGASLAMPQSEPGLNLVAFLNVDTNPVDKARNLLIDKAREANADWLLMVDSDVWCEDGWQLRRMLNDGVRAGAAIIGAPVMRRGRESLMVYKSLEGYGLRAFNPEQELVHVDAIGTSIFAFDLKAIGEVRFHFSGGLSEDLYFCDRMRARGARIMVDGRVRTAHRERPNPIWSRPK